MKPIAIIPARYASTRFPGKPLALLGGKPIIQHVYQRAKELLPTVVVATDDERIYRVVEDFGGQAVMTRSDHQSGTDRIAEALEKIGGDYDVVINIQGDEPFLQREHIERLLEAFDYSSTQIATLAVPFHSIRAAESSNSPKIVTDLLGYALYFSRSVIPFVRGKDRNQWLDHFPFVKHIGVYAYRAQVLREITQLPQSPLELAESLEQLRWLQNGYKIKVQTVSRETVGIDTPDDLREAEKLLAQGE